MALKLTKENSTEFTYARIERVFYSKLYESEILVETKIRDSEDATIDVASGRMSFRVPVQTPQDFLSLEAMSVADSNLIKQAYLWLKQNIQLFANFQDC